MYLNIPVLLRMKFINISTMKYEKQDYFRGQRQVLYDQLLPNPPGPEGSKGRRL
jgi:hypothetical protein